MTGDSEANTRTTCKDFTGSSYSDYATSTCPDGALRVVRKRGPWVAGLGGALQAPDSLSGFLSECLDTVYERSGRRKGIHSRELKKRAGRITKIMKVMANAMLAPVSSFPTSP